MTETLESRTDDEPVPSTSGRRYTYFRRRGYAPLEAARLALAPSETERQRVDTAAR